MPTVLEGEKAPKILFTRGTDENPIFEVKLWHYIREQGVYEGYTRDYSLEELRTYYPTLVPDKYKQAA